MANRIEKIWQTKAGLMAACLVMIYEKDGEEYDSHRCGYVAVPFKHKAWGVNCSDVSVFVHGGLTFNSHVGGEDYPAKHNNAWWLGFDCNHYQDKAIEDPYFYNALFDREDASVRSQKYVESECENLAKQLNDKNLSIAKYFWTTEGKVELWKKRLYNWTVTPRWIWRYVSGRPIPARRNPFARRTS